MATFSVILVTAPPFGTGFDPAASSLKVDGREALLRSVEMFLNRDEIKQVQLVVPADQIEDIRLKHGAHLGFSGVVLSGAPARFGEQLKVAADKLHADCTHVLVHDAARCCVPYTDIDALLATAEGKTAIACLSQRIKGDMVELDEGGNPLGVMQGTYVQLALPMLLTRAKFSELATAKRAPHASELTLISGSNLNIRFNGAQDGLFVKAMLAMLPKAKTKAASSPFEEAQW